MAASPTIPCLFDGTLIAEGPLGMPRLMWDGKEAVVNYDKRVPIHLLDEVPELAIPGDADKPTHTLIEGDNLLALKALMPRYKGRVKCIYIDPPYNTGNEGWVYNDNVNNPLVKRFTDWVGKEVGKEDLSRHDKWLCFMYPRLVLMRDLLRLDGAIFVAIDDNEQSHLRLMLDEIFGGENFLANFVWQSKDTPGNNSSGIAETHNHILAYCRSTAFTPSLLDRSEKQVGTYQNPDNDPRGPWLGSTLTRAEHRDRDYYALINPAGRKILPPKGSSWRRPPAMMKQMEKDKRIWWGRDGDADFPKEKKYLTEVKDGVVNQTWWPYTFAGSTRNASSQMKDIFGGEKAFDTPKPVQLAEVILRLACDDDSIVLDAFAGSGTTGHAVMKLNSAEERKMECVLIQTGKDQQNGPNIAKQITHRRLSCASLGYRTHKDESVAPLSQSWSYFSIGSRFLDPNHPPATIPFARLAPIVFWQATGESMPPQKKERAYLGTSKAGTAVFLLYNGDMEDKDPKGDNALNRETWRRIKRQVEQAKRAVVYCTGVAGVASLIREFEVKIEQMPRCLERIGE